MHFGCSFRHGILFSSFQKHETARYAKHRNLLAPRDGVNLFVGALTTAGACRAEKIPSHPNPWTGENRRRNFLRSRPFTHPVWGRRNEGVITL